MNKEQLLELPAAELVDRLLKEQETVTMMSLKVSQAADKMTTAVKAATKSAKRVTALEAELDTAIASVKVLTATLEDTDKVLSAYKTVLKHVAL